MYENIENFFGNKNEILLFGESAGATSVNLHMMNEESRKYFNRVYLGSGSGFSSRILSENDHVDRMKNFTQIDDTEHLIQFLKTMDSQTLADCYPMNSFGTTLVLPWVPTIESSDTVGAFITKSAEEIYNSNEVPAIDALFSFTSQECIMLNPGIIKSTEPLLQENLKDSTLTLPFSGSNDDSNKLEQALQKLKTAHYSDVTEIGDIRRANINLMSELNIVDSLLKSVVFQTNVNNNNTTGNSDHKKVFLFRFSVDADLNAFKVRNHLDFDGATHAEDLCYYFHCHHLDPAKVYENHIERRDMPYEAIMRIVRMITNFARTGDPSIEGDTPFKPCKSSTEMFCQEIFNNPKSSMTTDIMEQLHYNTWREIEQTFRGVNIGSQEDCQEFSNTI